MRYEREAITMLVYARNSIDTWHRLKFLRPSFMTYKFYKNAKSCLSQIFNQFSHIRHLLVISVTTNFELQKSNYFCCFNINASEKKMTLSASAPGPAPVPVPVLVPVSVCLSLSLSLSLSLHLINNYVIYNGSLFSEAFIFYGFKFIVECKTSF